MDASGNAGYGLFGMDDSVLVKTTTGSGNGYIGVSVLGGSAAGRSSRFGSAQQSRAGLHSAVLSFP